MIKDGKMFLDLPEDWKKIIRRLRDGPAFLEDLPKSTGIDYKKAKSIIMAIWIVNFRPMPWMEWHIEGKSIP